MFASFQKKKNSLEPRQSRDEAGARPGTEERQPEISAPLAQAEASEEPAGALLLNKGHLDKKSLDLLFAVEQMIQAKQQIEMSRQDLQDRLSHANGQADRLSKDLKNLGKVVEEREKTILELEQRLIDKNLKIDQMMEDYRELHVALSGEVEELKGAIELERQNYAGLLQKYNETTAEKSKRINELEEKNARLEAELSQTKHKFDALRQEKTHLLHLVNDFTSRMTSPFASNAGPLDGAPAE